MTTPDQKKKVKFDPTLSLGSVLQVCAIVAGIISLYISAQVKFAELDLRVKILESSQSKTNMLMEKVQETLTRQTVNQETTSKMLDLLTKDYRYGPEKLPVKVSPPANP